MNLTSKIGSRLASIARLAILTPVPERGAELLDILRAETQGSGERYLSSNGGNAVVVRELALEFDARVHCGIEERRYWRCRARERERKGEVGDAETGALSWESSAREEVF